MDKPDPDLPRGMLRIAKRGDALDASPSRTVLEDVPRSDSPSGAVSESEQPASNSSDKNVTDPPRRGVLRINTADFEPQNTLRQPRPQSPMGRTFMSRGGPRPRQMAPVFVRSPAASGMDIPMVPRMDLGRPMRIAVNVSRPVVPAVSASVSKGTLTPEGKSAGPVFASDFATQEIFKALEQAKPTSVPKPPISELSEEEKNDPNSLREFYLMQLRMMVKDSQVLREFTMSKPVKLIDSYFFWCLRKGTQFEQLVQAVNPRNQNFQVVGVIGLQETGKSYILSQLVGQKSTGPVFGSFSSVADRTKPYGKFRTEGIDCFISRQQRTIFLDVQPVYSGSVLEEMITGERKPPVVSSEHVFVEHTVELQSIMYGAFLLSVCHKIIVVMKTSIDERILRFLRLATILKLGPVHKDALNEANLFDHWPSLIFVNNMCHVEDLYFERVRVAQEKLASLMKDYPLRYNGHPNRNASDTFEGSDAFEGSEGSKMLVDGENGEAVAAGGAVMLYLIPDADALGRDEYLKAEWVNQLRLLKQAVVGNIPRESVTPGMAMGEKEWFKYARRCWAAVCKAPLVNSIAKELNLLFFMDDNSSYSGVSYMYSWSTPWWTLALLAFLFFVRVRFSQLRRRLPPGPIGYPIVGCLLDVPQDAHLYFTDLARKHGDVISLRLGNRLTVILSSASAIREAYRRVEFAGRPRNYLVKLYNTHFTGIVDASYSNEWKKHRHFALKSMAVFGLGKSSFEAQILAETQHLYDILAIHPMALDPGDFIVAAISNLICVLMFGHRFEYSDKEFQSILRSLRETFASLVSDRSRDYIPLLRLIPNGFVKKHVELFENVKKYIRMQIDDHRKTRKVGEPRDYVDVFLEEMNNDKRTGFTEDWLVNIVFDFFAAGTETTATVLRWTLLHLAKYPDVQEKVLAEIRSVYVDDEMVPQFEDVKNMPFTEAVMCEILRLCTVAPLALVHSTMENTEIASFDIPKDTDVYFNLWAMHHNEHVWETPYDFKPERFLREDGQCRKDFPNYLPFGTGHRGCMGEQLAKMEFFLFLVTIVRGFAVQFPDGLEPDKLVGTYKLVHEPRSYDLVIRKRNSAA